MLDGYAGGGRRRVLQCLAGMAIAPVALRAASVRAATAPAPGKPGDFDFLEGRWNISHRRLKAPGDWDTFKGEATCWSILGGRGSVEELRIPTRDFSGLGLRLLDAATQRWSDHWVNGKSGVLTCPGMLGGFENGVGTFEADDEDGGRPIKVRGVWDRITPHSCRWHQAVSRDGGRHWEENWWMEWVRA